MKPFRDGLRYLSEGGQETELMYGHGFDLPQFALFPLLDHPAAVAKLTELYSEVLGLAEKGYQFPSDRKCSLPIASH